LGNAKHGNMSVDKVMPQDRELFPERFVPAPAPTPAPVPDRVREAAHDPSGHRARLRKRLLSGSDDALADHEVIEAC
jgi:DNA repair protein RadC